MRSCLSIHDLLTFLLNSILFANFLLNICHFVNQNSMETANPEEPKHFNVKLWLVGICLRCCMLIGSLHSVVRTASCSFYCLFFTHEDTNKCHTRNLELRILIHHFLNPSYLASPRMEFQMLKALAKIRFCFSLVYGSLINVSKI